MSDVHKENIEYYGMITRRRDVEIAEVIGAKYYKLINKVLTNDEELKHYNIEFNEVMKLVKKSMKNLLI